MRQFVLSVFISSVVIGCAGTLPKYNGPYADRGMGDKPLILGQVKLTAAVEPGTPILEAIQKARGLTESAAEKNAVLYCPGEEMSRIDLHALVWGDMTQNAVLRPGCYLWVPKSLKAELGSWFGMFRGVGDVYFILDGID